jgi:hypothetical protein
MRGCWRDDPAWRDSDRWSACTAATRAADGCAQPSPAEGGSVGENRWGQTFDFRAGARTPVRRLSRHGMRRQKGTDHGGDTFDIRFIGVVLPTVAPFGLKSPRFRAGPPRRLRAEDLLGFAAMPREPRCMARQLRLDFAGTVHHVTTRKYHWGQTFDLWEAHWGHAFEVRFHRCSSTHGSFDRPKSPPFRAPARLAVYAGKISSVLQRCRGKLGVWPDSFVSISPAPFIT